jgi:hypothetical protein
VTNAVGVAVSSNAVLTVPIAGATGTLVSSVNPSLPGQPVSFTFTLSPVAPATGTPGGLVQIKVDGTIVGQAILLVSGVARYTSSSLMHGTHTVVASYAGDANFIGTTNTLSPSQLVNTPPVAGPDTIQRDPTSGAKVSIATLLGNDSDADGDTLTFLSVNASSANGGTVVSNSGWIFYTPATGFTNTDTFTYTIGDGFGGPVTGSVNVSIGVNNGPSSHLAIIAFGGGSYLIRGDGVPGRSYRIQYLDQPQSRNWQTLATVTANSVGVFAFTNSSGSPQRLYRSMYVKDPSHAAQPYLP